MKMRTYWVKHDSNHEKKDTHKKTHSFKGNVRSLRLVFKWSLRFASSRNQLGLFMDEKTKNSDNFHVLAHAYTAST